MFERHFGLRENPFHSGHQLRFLYPSREHQEARAHLRYGIENREPFVLITGEVGTGKTTALYDALAEWGTRVAVALITNSALTRQELIEEIGLRFGLTVPPGASKPQALALLERHLTAVRARGEFAVLLLDEAQNLAPELLEEIRLLSNLEAQGERLVQIFLVGQPELEALLAKPQLRQLRQRIGVHYRLNPLSPEETAAYIHHRVAVAGGNPWATFPPETCREVYRVTHGIPREINTVASQALITAFSEGATTVQPGHVHAAAQESEFRSVLGAPRAEGVAAAAPAPTTQQPRGLGAEPAAEATPAAQQPLAREPEPVAEATPAPPPVYEASPLAVPPTPTPTITPAMATAAGDLTPGPEPAPAWTPPELEASEIAPWPPSEPEAPAAPTEPAAPATPAAPAEPAAIQHPVAEAAQAVDAWTAAAQELMEARRRGALPEAPARVEVVATPETTRATQERPSEPPPAIPSPAEPRARTEHARPDAANVSALPGRLRDKIAADIASEQRREASRRRAVPLALAAVTLVALGVGVVVMQRLHVIDVPALRGLAGARAADSTAHAATAAAVREPIAVVRPSQTAAVDTLRRDSLAASRDTARTAPAEPGAFTAAHATASAPVAVPPVAATTAPAPHATPPAAAAYPDSLVYGLSVASYLDRDRAELERQRLAKASGLPAAVLPYRDAGSTKFRVVIGRYPSNAAAENAALALMESLGVDEARPLLLPRAKRR